MIANMSMGSDIFQPQTSITYHTSAEHYVKNVNTYIPAGTKANHALLHQLVPKYKWVTTNNAMHTLYHDI